MTWPGRLTAATEWEQVLEAILPPLALVDALPQAYASYAELAPRDKEDDGWWSACQHTLLTVTLVTWTPILQEHALYEPVLNGWFVPPASARVWLHTLHTCSALLSGSIQCHASTLDAVAHILARFHAPLVLLRTLEAVRAEPHLARRDLMWSDAVAQIAALPTRVANTFGPLGHALLDVYKPWLSQLMCACPDVLPNEAERVAVLITRLSRIGVVERMWDAILPHAQARAWRSVLGLCDAPTQEALITSLVRTMQTRLLPSHYAWPVAHDELAPGTEGRAFLSHDAWRWGLTAYDTLHTIAAEVLDRIHVLLHVVNTPLMAMAATSWAMEKEAVVTLEGLVQWWSDPRRIRYATYPLEQCVTTQMLTAIRHSDTTPLATHAHSPMFLRGVSSHLEHTDARVRRLGMLVAEVLSQATNPKPLAFPEQVWEGRGDGRGACRVLRAMYLREMWWPDEPPYPWPTGPIWPVYPPPRTMSPPSRPRPLVQDLDASSDSETSTPDDPNDTSTMLGDALQKKARVPVYVYELAPLARKRDYEANKCVIKHAEALIRRKTGWGHEIAEHGTDLAIALASMQDTYDMEAFDERRTRALSALCIAAPMPVVDTLYEQFFTPHYSLAQRLSMLRAVASAAVEMSGSRACTADTLAEAAVQRATAAGEARISKAHAMARVSLPFAPPWSVRPTASYTAVATHTFIYPLIRRLDHARQETSRMYAGSDTALVPGATSALLHTLCVLCYHARNAAFFMTRVLPDILEVIEVWGSNTHADVGTAAMSLAIVVLDMATEADGGAHLVKSHSAQLLRIQTMAHASADVSQQAAAVVLCIADMQERMHQALLAK